MPRAGREIVVVEAGISAAATHIAIDRHWLVEHARGRRPNLLRFYRNHPAVVIGHHQSAEHEVRLDYCRTHAIAVTRRNTGGGALYVDEQQLGWSFIVRRPRKWRGVGLASFLEICCGAIAQGLRRLGLDARFKALNDIEIEGRKIASAYVTALGESLLFHGTILCDADIARIMQALRVPTEKLSPAGLAGARRRLTTLTDQLGAGVPIRNLKPLITTALLDAFGLKPRNATKAVYAALRDAPVEPPEDGFPQGIRVEPAQASQGLCAEALWKSAGGLLRVRLEFDTAGRRLTSAAITSDLFVQPADLLRRLELWLQGTALADVEQRLDEFLRRHPADMPGVGPQDLRRALQLALNRLDEQHRFGITREQANRLMILGTAEGLTAAEILQRAQAMLVPYCAKPVDCAWRNRNGCPECGRCEVSEAYRLGRAHGLQVISINNYEHLCNTLGELRHNGVRGIVGMCCQNFFIKRNQAFKDAGIPMVLMDISGSNCYELGQEEQAYAGSFQAKAQLDVPLLRRLMHYTPNAGVPSSVLQDKRPLF